MYEKKFDSVIKAHRPMKMAGASKKADFLSSLAIPFLKHSLYAVGIVLVLFVTVYACRSLFLLPALASDGDSSVKTSPIVQDQPLCETATIVPKISVTYHGNKLGEFEGDGVAVEEILGEFDIELCEGDVMNYSPDDLSFFGMSLVIDLVEYKEEIVEEEIPFETIRRVSQNVPKGERYVAVEGQCGFSQKVVRTKYVNGEATDESEHFTRVIDPVNREEFWGVGGVFTAPDGQQYRYSYYLDVTATAYTHTGDPTYSGTVAEVGVIAVDPRNIDLGSNVYVIGNYGDYGVCRAEDIGGGIKGLRIDVFLDTEEECVIFGRREMRAYVLDE